MTERDDTYTDAKMDPKLRRRLINLILRLCDVVPSEKIPALENFLLELLPEPEEEYDPEVLQLAKEIEAIRALEQMDANSKKPS